MENNLPTNRRQIPLYLNQHTCNFSVRNLMKIRSAVIYYRAAKIFTYKGI
jgi:hypothetical protein